MLNLDQPMNTTLDAQTQSQRERERDIFTRFDKIAYIPGAEKRSIFDLHEITRGFTIGSLKNSLFSHLPQNGLHLLFIEKRRNSQIHSILSPKSPLTRLSVDRPVDRPKCAVDRPIDRAKSYKIAGLRSTSRPTGFFSSLSSSIDWVVDWSKPYACRSTEVLS